MLTGKRIVITGGTGSLGKVLVRLLECGSNILSGADPEPIARSARLILQGRPRWRVPPEYLVDDASATATKIVVGRHEFAPKPNRGAAQDTALPPAAV